MPSAPRRSKPATAWIESLDPWPRDGFGLERMRTLLRLLGDPQLAYPSIHVVGTNGKGSTTRTIEETLQREGLVAGAYYSPHVTGWAERIRVAGEEADFEAALERVRPDASRLGATQFEALTAAALAEFAELRVEVAVVEAGLGGRYDATNVLRSPVQVLTNVALEHTRVLGSTRAEIAAEKLAVVQPGAIVVIGEPEWKALALANGAARVIVETGGNRAVGGVAASAFLGREVAGEDVTLPGRFERRTDEIRDGAHTPEALRFMAHGLPRLGSIVASILADKDVKGMLAILGSHADTLVATTSSHPNALPADELARRAEGSFRVVEWASDPVSALARAHELGSPVLVTGSLYLLADLAAAEPESRVP